LPGLIFYRFTNLSPGASGTSSALRDRRGVRVGFQIRSNHGALKKLPDYLCVSNEAYRFHHNKIPSAFYQKLRTNN
jgi:hypothetical protein